MSSFINAQKQEQTLCLAGVLDSSTLHDIWSQQSQLLSQINTINVAQLTRVDSSGLALLVYVCIKYNLKLVEVNQQLKTLIQLYDLQPVLECEKE